MGNSYNISVAPEIAALDAKIDIIDTEIDAIRAVDIPATDASIAALSLLIPVPPPAVNVLASNFIIQINTPEVSHDGGAYAKDKESLILFAGTVRVSFDLKAENTSNFVFGKIYINGAPQGIERTTNLDTYTTYTEDFTVAVNDLIQIYVKNPVGATDSYVKNLLISGDVLPNVIPQDP